MSINTVVKSDGSVVPFDPSKVNMWAKYASDNGVSWSEIAMKAIKKCYDGCRTSDIQQAMIDACVEMEDTAHLRMAGRILLGSIYKEAHGGFRSIPSLKDFYHSMVTRGLWEDMKYSDVDLEFLSGVIDHNKNMSKNYSYTALKQMRDKYLSQDLISHVCHESPQFMFMGVAMQSMINQPKNRRLVDILNAYHYLSDLKINLSTPMLVNLRTPNKGLASCCVYTTDDTANSLAVGDHIAYMMTCASAGIGSHLTTRSKGDPIRHGSVVHQGKLPYFRMIESAVHANKQACYDDETTLLTNRGFILFKDLTDTDLVAQVDGRGGIDFVEPVSIFEYDFKGKLVSFKDNENGQGSIVVTDNHKMVVADDRSVNMADMDEDSDFDDVKLLEFIDAGELEPDNDVKFMTSGYINNINSSAMSSAQMLYIYLVSNSSFVSDDHVLFHPRCVDYIGDLIKFFNEDEANSHEMEAYISEDNPYMLMVDFTSLEETFYHDLYTNTGSGTIRDMIEYISFSTYGGLSETSSNGDPWMFVASQKHKKLVDVLCSMGGVTRTYDFFEHAEIFQIHLDSPTFVASSNFVKSEVEYDGKVYCVEVPTNRLVIKRDNIVMVCGNSRGGANTTYFSVIDPEIKDLIVLKNPTTVLQKRIRNIDYAVNMNRFFVERVAKNEDWYTISYYHAKELHDAFYSSDYELFKKMYEKYENHEHAVKCKARDLAIDILTESVETGRIYIHYVDEANRHTPFKDTIYSSNLCLEIELPTNGFKDMPDLYSDNPEGEIGLCSLSSIVLGRVSDEEYEDVAYYVSLLVDNTIDLMDYPFPALKRTAMARRSIGIGMTNMAHALASKGLSYASQEGKKYIHQMAERHSYHLYRASLRLGKEKGNAEWMHKTKYPEGWTPMKTYNRNVDELVDVDLQFDWDQLSEDIKANGGIRNSTLIAIPPNESSSQLTNTTNSVYPIRSLKVIKTSGTGRNILLAPDIDELKNVYDIAWELDSKDLIDMYAIVQKFTDQGISPDLYVSFQNSKLLSSRNLLADLIRMMKYGCKSRYYINSQSGVDAELYNKGGAEVVDESDMCASCVL